METFIGIIIFLAGYLSQKAIDLFLYKLRKFLKYNKVRKKVSELQKNITVENSDILPLAFGKPIFKCKHIDISIDTNSYFLLAFPPELMNNLTASSGQFAQRDIFNDKIYIDGISEENLKNAIEAARLKIAKGFINRTDGLYFNGKRFGISYFDAFSRTCDEKEQPILTIKLYNTDHFTHKVIEEALRSLNSFNFNFSLEKLNRNYKFIRTSLGISIIVLLKSSNELVLTYRSKNAAYANGINWIYVSATEAVTSTDYDSYIDKPRLDFCVKRGLVEELGITEDMYNPADIYFTDYFFERNFMQDGIVAVVKLDERISFADVCEIAKKSKDYDLEIDGIFVIKNEEKTIKTLISQKGEIMREQTKFALNSYCARL